LFAVDGPFCPRSLLEIKSARNVHKSSWLLAQLSMAYNKLIWVN
jgi:hypothetical protein